MNLLQRGSRNRQIAETMLNQSSSRSHCIFSIKFVQVPRGVDKAALQENPSLIKYCRLSLIDLAGSERASRTKSTGARLREAGAINKSLMSFGRCIKALRFNQLHPTRNPQVIPYRESKLTRLLQDLFSGNARAVMFVNLCPDPTDFDESVHVLKFSAIATRMCVCVCVFVMDGGSCLCF
jgi:kinesin family member 20